MGPITLPKQITSAQAQLQLTPGTYSQLVTDTLGTEDWASGPSLSAIDHSGGLLAGMGDDPFGGNDAIAKLANLGGSIPNQGASTFAADMAAAQAAQAVKTQAVTDAVATIPTLLELPMNPAGYGSSVAPPTIIQLDLGTLSLSGPPALSFLGASANIVGLGPSGLQNVAIVDVQGGIAQIIDQQRENEQGSTHDEYWLQFTPTALGQATVQVNYNQDVGLALTMITYTANVVP